MKSSVLKTMEPFKNKSIILSVSGGIDSLVLFDLLYNNHFNLIIVHFNHLKREQSHQEANYIKNLCERLSLSYHYFELFIDENENFHHQAHHLRKKHLKEVAIKYQTNIIVTAHHLNDLAESVLLKLSRGSNLIGYAGMQTSYFKDDFYFIKPLLNTSKEEIISYATENDVFYFEDDSNYSLDYQRNKVRMHVIPYLIEDNPNFLNKISQYSETLGEAFNYIRKSAQTFLNERFEFVISSFKKLEPIVQKEVLSYLLEEHKINPTIQKINDIIRFLDESGPNNSYDIGNNYVVQKIYNKALIKEKMIPIKFKEQLNLDGINRLLDGSIIIFNNTNNEILNNEVILCYNKLVLPLWARTRQDGDTLYFSYGHKKLKDFFIDKKIPKHIRDSSIIITDNNNQILAVLGLYVNTNPNLNDKITLNYRRP